MAKCRSSAEHVWADKSEADNKSRARGKDAGVSHRHPEDRCLVCKAPRHEIMPLIDGSNDPWFGSNGLKATLEAE